MTYLEFYGKFKD